MVDYNAIRIQLLKDIENEKGFSWRKLAKIFELNGLYNRD